MTEQTMSSNNNKEVESESNNEEDKQCLLAQQTLSYRPTFYKPSLIPKGGPKYSDFNGTAEESARLENYYESAETALSSWKVRKLANLGLAEWLPELSVAKIIKQGKFMQTKGFHHEMGFLALYPEEALFLLDVGDIEVSYKGALLTLQDAYNLILSATPNDDVCTVDEYCVYAHLTRMGYRLQRFSISSASSDEDSDEVELATTSKRALPVDTEPTETNENKRTKLAFINQSPVEEVPDEKIATETAETRGNNSRKWWKREDGSLEDSAESGKPACHNQIHGERPTQVSFPDLGTHLAGTLVLSEIDPSLLPPDTAGCEFKVVDIWHERLKRDDRGSSAAPLKFSHDSKVNFAALNQEADNWPQYKRMLETAKQEKAALMNSLHELMNSGSVKPIVQPQSAFSSKKVLDDLKIFKQFSHEAHFDSCRPQQCYKITFNVYQTDATKPFRKSRPGKPFRRVCVVSSNDPLPTLADTVYLNNLSDGVPVKIALVDAGRVVFFAFDSIDIPTDVF